MNRIVLEARLTTQKDCEVSLPLLLRLQTNLTSFKKINLHTMIYQPDMRGRRIRTSRVPRAGHCPRSLFCGNRQFSLIQLSVDQPSSAQLDFPLDGVVNWTLNPPLWNMRVENGIMVLFHTVCWMAGSHVVCVENMLTKTDNVLAFQIMLSKPRSLLRFKWWFSYLSLLAPHISDTLHNHFASFQIWDISFTKLEKDH